MKRPQIILIIGCQRSGTSWLCSMIGAHSKINMSYESIDDSVMKYSGCPFNGNKLIAEQIGMKLKANFIGHLLNRITKPFKYRIWPISSLSINDYIKQNTKMIILIRDRRNNLNSIQRRLIDNSIIANMIYYSAMRKIDKIETDQGIIMSDDILEIKYEDLMQDRRKELLKICDYIGINFEKEMLEGENYIHNYLNN